jgi:hypothetical protein
MEIKERKDNKMKKNKDKYKGLVIEPLKSRIKRRIKLATWYDIGCMILIALALFMLGDIAVSRMNGTFSYNSAGFVPYEEQIAQILEEKDNATYKRTTSKNIDYGKLEEKFLKSLEEKDVHPVTKDLLMLGLKFYELSDARMRTIIDNGDKIGDVAVDFATQIQEDHENGIEMKDRASQFVEDVSEKLEDSEEDVSDYSAEEIYEHVEEDITNLLTDEEVQDGE